MSLDYAARVTRLARLADELEHNRESIVAALVGDIELSRKSAGFREVSVPADLLRACAAKSPPPDEARVPYDRAAVVLPYNAVNICGVMSMATAFLAGVPDIVVRIPSRLTRFLPLYRRIVESVLPGVRFSDMPGPAFLEKCFHDPELGVIAAFGDDRWMVRYRDVARSSGTKVVFEGPGKDPFLVFDDADVVAAADAATRASYSNAGQSCSSPERFYVQDTVVSAFIEHVLERTRKFRVGHSEADDTEIGPIGSSTVTQRLKNQFEDARARGARILTGGELVLVPGNKYESCLPTVLVNCSHDMALFRDETFGPVVAVMPFHTEEQALELAEDSTYGLTATVFGGRREVRARLEMSHGNVFSDSCIVDPIHSTCRLYWGGFKNSGWIWEWQGPNFVRREGPRWMVREYTRPRDS